jgi:Trp operon repressor
MSKTKMMTMSELKEKTSDIILSNDEYEAIIERINVLINELIQSSELNDRNEIKEIYYKKEIDDLVSRRKEYKNKIKSKEDLDLVNEEIMKYMTKNKTEGARKTNGEK